mgnify:CR=1 FL=1
MRVAYLGLGSNLGDRRAHLQEAVGGLNAADAVRVTGCSPVYETEAHTVTPDEEQPPFLNAVVQAAVDCSPDQLLRLAKQLERVEGRTGSSERWAPRPLDVDLLMVGNATRQTDDLVLPHPRLADRRFVLQPWADLAPDVIVPPPFDASVRDLLRACPDTAALRRTDLPLHPSAASDST